MVYGQIVKGSAKEIAEQITKIVGDRRISVLLMNDTVANELNGKAPDIAEIEKALADIQSMAVNVGHVDDSREAIYTRMAGE